MRQRGRSGRDRGGFSRSACCRRRRSSRRRRRPDGGGAADAKLSDRLEELSAGRRSARARDRDRQGFDRRRSASLLDGEHVANVKGNSLVVGTLRPAAPQLATTDGVIHANAVESRRTGRPVRVPKPGVSQAASPRHGAQAPATKRRHDKGWQDRDDDPLAGSNFDAYGKLNLLRRQDPPLRRRLERRLTRARARPSPSSTAAPTWPPGPPRHLEDRRRRLAGGVRPVRHAALARRSRVHRAGPVLAALTQAPTALPQRRKRRTACAASCSSATGPVAQLRGPRRHGRRTFTFPARVDAGGLGAAWAATRTTICSSCTGSVPPILVDKNADGAYETVYVDLDGDYAFTDEKPVTKASPASYRDMNGDGYIDISGGLLYFIADGETAARSPGGRRSPFGEGSVIGRRRPALLAWTGDFDPALGGHGTLTASNVAGQAVINGRAPSSTSDYGTYPGAVIGGAPKAKLVPYRRHLLLVRLLDAARLPPDDAGRGRRHVELLRLRRRRQRRLRRREPGGRLLARRFVNANATRSSRRATARRASARSLRPPRHAASPSEPPRSSAAPAGTRSRDYSQIVENDVMVWSNRGPGATGSPGVDVVADGALLGRRHHAEHGPRRPQRVGDVGRHEPLDARRGRRRGARVPGVARFARRHAADASTVKNILDVVARWTSATSRSSRAPARSTPAQPVTLARPARRRRHAERVAAGRYRGPAVRRVHAHLAPGGSDTQTFSVAGGGRADVVPTAT